MTIVYLWSRKQPDRAISIYGFLFQSWHLPFVMLILTLIMGGNLYLDLLGLFVGHSIYFVKDVIPAVYRFHILKTPGFVYDMFESNRPRVVPMPRGGGYRLGDN